jgi:tetratricopeptide (TPR) repeat protein
MMVWPRIPLKRATFVGLLGRFSWPRANQGRAHPSPALAAKGGDIGLWRGYLRRSEEALRKLDLRSVGVPEDEADPELCLVKGEVLRRAGHGHDAQRFLRQAPRLSPSRRDASAVALRAAAQDFGFQRIIQEADQARDAAEWREAGELYSEALRAYPDHYGYVVQYAHCLKEQGQLVEAECHYRSALALGAARSDVDEHLTFVATQSGYPVSFAGDWEATSGDGGPLDAPPTKGDVELVVFLLLGREPALAEIVQLLRRHRSLRSLIMAIVEEGSFVSANARLLSTRNTGTAPVNPAVLE